MTDSTSEVTTVLLPNVLKYTDGLIIENDLEFDPEFCGSGLTVSNNNLHLKRTEETSEWHTCRANANSGWSEGIHYWSIKIHECTAQSYLSIGIVTQDFDVTTVNYMGKDNNGYCLYLLEGHKLGNSKDEAFTVDIPKNGDVVGVLLDLKNRTLSFFKNGQMLGTAYGLLPLDGTNTKYYPAVTMHVYQQWVSFVETTKSQLIL